MYDARNSLRPLRLAAVRFAVSTAVSVAGAMLAGCSGEAPSEPPTGGSTSSPSEPSPGAAKGGTPATSTTSPGGMPTAAATGAPPNDSNLGPDAGPAPAQDSGATTSTGKQLGETCAQNSDCKSAECFMGGMGSYCSLLCTPGNAATVCVAPFSGVCNNKGYCKK